MTSLTNDSNSPRQKQTQSYVKEPQGLGKVKEPILSIHKIIKIGSPFQTLQINKSCRMLTALSKDCKKLKLFLFENVFEIRPLLASGKLFLLIFYFYSN